MKFTWNGLFVVALLLAAVLFVIGTLVAVNLKEKRQAKSEQLDQVVKTAQSISCPAPDTITYPDHAKQTTYTCPTQGQELTMVREPGYPTYFKCSCRK